MKKLTTRQDSASHELRYIGYFSSATVTLSTITRAIVLFLLGVSFIQGNPLPALLVLALVFDLCQYLYKSAIWGWHCFRINNFPKHRAYGWTNFPTNFFFFGKAVLLVIYLASSI